MSFLNRFFGGFLNIFFYNSPRLKLAWCFVVLLLHTSFSPTIAKINQLLNESYLISATQSVKHESDNLGVSQIDYALVDGSYAESYNSYDFSYLMMPHAYREYIDRVQRFSLSNFRTEHRAYNSKHIREPYVFMQNIDLRDMWNMRRMWWGLYDMSWLSSGNYEPYNQAKGLFGQRIIIGEQGGCTNGGKVAYSLSNRTTTNLLKANYIFNLQHGVSMQLAANIGGGKSLSIEGQGKRSGSFMLGLNKILNQHNSLNLLLLAGSSFSGSRAAITEEARDLVGNSLYNPNWGFYGEDMRNARGSISHGVSLVLGHVYSSLNSSVRKQRNIRTNLFVNINSYQKRNINWSKAPNPWPDNYRNMPSFESDPQMKQYLTDLWKSDNNGSISQINYQEMCNFNAQFASQTGEASYILERSLRNSCRASLVSSYGSWLQSYNNENESLAQKIAYLNIELGVDLQYDRHTKVLDDLLGASHWVDVDNFVEQITDVKELTQSNAFTPNRNVYEGQEFGYKYDISMIRPRAAINLSSANNDRLAWNLSASALLLFARRIGYYHKQNFELTDSYGMADYHALPEFSASAIARYILGAGFELKGSLGLELQSPSLDNLFINPRYRASLISSQIDLSSVLSAELTLRFRRPGIYTYASMYINNIASATQLTNFYDEISRYYSHYIMRQMDMRYIGFELSSEFQLNDNLWLQGMLRISSNTFTSDPVAQQIVEATGESILEEKVFWAGKHCGQGAEDVFRVEFSYRPHRWLLNLGLNLMGNTYIDPSPIKYTARAHEYVSMSDMPYSVFDQQRLSPAITLDLFCGRTVYFRSNNRLGLYIGINNLTNNRNIITGGYESSRFRQNTKYYYALGINGFVNISYTF